MKKTCFHCGKSFIPNHRYGQKRIAIMKFCSQFCARAAQQKISEINCAACGTLFTPRNKRGRYCGKVCAASVHKGPKMIKGWGERYKRVSAPDGTRQLEHRVVMSKIIGRPLEPYEQVHHKNGDRFDNTPENLELWYRSQPTGQRVDDLIAYIIKNHRSKLLLQLSYLLGEPEFSDRNKS